MELVSTTDDTFNLHYYEKTTCADNLYLQVYCVLPTAVF